MMRAEMLVSAVEVRLPDSRQYSRSRARLNYRTRNVGKMHHGVNVFIGAVLDLEVVAVVALIGCRFNVFNPHLLHRKLLSVHIEPRFVAEDQLAATCHIASYKLQQLLIKTM